MIAHGTPLPDFSLPDQTGTVRHRAEYAGRWLALYCYPRDTTTGCSLEAAAFAALAGQFAGREAPLWAPARIPSKAMRVLRPSWPCPSPC